MRLVKLCHRLEQGLLFSRAAWISQTNAERLKLFLGDNPGVNAGRCWVMPNYPPADWYRSRNRAWGAGDTVPTAFVYVGSLSLRDTYVREFVAWLLAQPPGSCRLDIYGYNVDGETCRFLTDVAGRSSRVGFHPEGIAYDRVPEILNACHVGLLLYRACTTNFVFNATNKLFEYLACGLDVIYPREMRGVRPYARSQMQPRVLEWDFHDGDSMRYRRNGRRQLPTADSFPACEDVYLDLVRRFGAVSG